MSGGPVEVAVIGDRIEGSEPQDAIGPALAHASTSSGGSLLSTRWCGTDELEREGAGTLLAGADAIWCAPGSPYRSFAGALEGIRYGREHDIPFLGTCAGFQHAVIEVARDVAGLRNADHAEYGSEGDLLLVDELACSLVGERLDVRIVDGQLAQMYGADVATERYYCRFGLNLEHLPALQDAGLVVAGVDDADGQPRVLRFAGHPFFWLTLFVPQTSSRPGAPHPIVSAFTAAAARAAATRNHDTA